MPPLGQRVGSEKPRVSTDSVPHEEWRPRSFIESVLRDRCSASGVACGGFGARMTSPVAHPMAEQSAAKKID
jgi:hypothetical protein